MSSLSRASIERIRSSYVALAPKAESFAESFYDRLFNRHPEVRGLFPTDMASQRKHLWAALALIARNADHLEALEGAIMQLGAAHVGYGARPEHYPLVRDAMVDALAGVAGPMWTKELDSDWRGALDQISAMMLKGAAVAGAVTRLHAGERPGQMPGPSAASA